MADNQPAQSTAPNGAAPQTPPSVPESKPADQQPGGNPVTLTLDSFSDDEKKYLQSQGVTDLSSPDAIKKIINHARSSQKTAADVNNQLNKIKESFGQPGDPVVTGTPGVPGTDPTASSQPQTDATAQPSGNGGLDPVTAFMLSNQLATSFPRLKDDLVSGQFYKEMAAANVPLTVNGQLNLKGLMDRAKLIHDNRELQAKLEEAGKPGENEIPDANPTTPQQPAADAPMTKQMAQAILYQDPNHPRAAEAKQFLQQNVGK